MGAGLTCQDTDTPTLGAKDKIGKRIQIEGTNL